MQRMRSVLFILVLLFGLLQSFRGSENITEILKSDSIVPNIDAITRHVCDIGYAPVLQEMSLVTPEYFNCSLNYTGVKRGASNGFILKKQRCNIEKAKKKVCSVIVLDGLGHFLQEMLGLLVARSNSFKEVSSLMPQEISKSMVYLNNVEGVYKPNQNNSIYCHEKSYLEQGELQKITSLNDIFQSHFECFLVPDFNVWFGFKMIQQQNMQSIFAAYKSRNDIYDKTELISCGKRFSEDKTLEIAYHLRIGDLAFPAIGANKIKTKNFHDRLKKSLKGLKEVLEWLKKLQSALGTIGWKINTYVSTDTPYEQLNLLLEEHKVQVEFEAVDEFFDGIMMRKNVRATTVHKNETVDLVFLGANGNPLLSLHCLASAHLLIRDHESHFSILAVLLMGAKNSARPEDLHESHIEQIVDAIKANPLYPHNVHSNLTYIGIFFHQDADRIVKAFLERARTLIQELL